MLATNRFFAKGGLGIINKNLYIVVRPTKNGCNELISKPSEGGAEARWTGASLDKPEVVFFFDGRVWSADALPSGFDLSKAVIVSFEPDKVRFFDFHAMSGGYYERSVM